jgi:hypothetical protein
MVFYVLGATPTKNLCKIAVSKKWTLDFENSQNIARNICV